MRALQRKLSVKVVHGAIDPKTVSDEVKFIVRFWGQCVRTKAITTNYGDSIALKGQFAGLNLETGEEYQASTLFMPDIATDAVVLAMQGDSGMDSVSFGFDIGVVKSDNAIGYEYQIKPLMKSEEQNDPLSVMAAGFDSVAKQIEAPKKPKGKGKGKNK